jgi:hypothetical protein
MGVRRLAFRLREGMKMATSRPSKFPRIPYSHIRWLVGKLHVGDSDAEVSGEIESRMRRVTLRGIWRKTERKFTEREIKEAVRYALACHEDNRKLYARVMRGAF